MRPMTSPEQGVFISIISDTSVHTLLVYTGDQSVPILSQSCTEPTGKDINSSCKF